MRYKLLISEEALFFLSTLQEKSRRILRQHLLTLGESPHPGRRGDKKKLNLPGYDLYRLHIGRSFTAFYRIYEQERTVRILALMTIDEAHKLYGRL